MVVGDSFLGYQDGGRCAHSWDEGPLDSLGSLCHEDSGGFEVGGVGWPVGFASQHFQQFVGALDSAGAGSAAVEGGLKAGPVGCCEGVVVSRYANRARNTYGSKTGSSPLGQRTEGREFGPNGDAEDPASDRLTPHSERHLTGGKPIQTLRMFCAGASVGRSEQAAGVAAVPLCGFVTTSSDPAAEPCDGVLLVCRSSRLRRCGHPVAFSSQVGTAPAARMLLGTQVVLWRTPNGWLRSALDRCPHRWAQLSAGTVTNGRLVCPYHGWQFGPDGAVVEIPQPEAGASLPPSACLQVLPTVEAHGMVWIYLEPQPSAPIPTIPEFDDSRFDRIEIGVIRYHASAAAIIDNNTDSTHVAFVHSGSFDADQDPRVPVGTVERTPFGISISSGRCRSPALPPRSNRAPGTR